MLAFSIALAIQTYHANFSSYRAGTKGLYHFTRERGLFLVILTLLLTQLLLLVSAVVRECVEERMDDGPAHGLVYVMLADIRLFLDDARCFASVVAILVASGEFRRDYKRYYLFWRASTVGRWSK